MNGETETIGKNLCIACETKEEETENLPGCCYNMFFTNSLFMSHD